MSTPSPPAPAPVRLLALVAVAFAAAVYLPITRNFFYAEDFFTLYRLVNGGFLRFVLEPEAGHVYVVRNGLVYLFDALFGPRPLAIFAAVLATHLLNVALVFAIVRRLTGSVRLACFGATLWGTSPVQEGALGWYAVYGQVVATAIVLAVLRDLVHRAEDAHDVRPRSVWAWCGLLLLASTCFGVAVGVALVFPAVAVLLRPGLRTRAALWRPLVVLPFATVALYAGLHLLWAETSGESVAGVWDLLGGWMSVASMLVHLAGAGIAGTVLGGVYPAARYPAPLALAALAAFAAALAFASVRAGRAARRHAAAVAVVALACYATIAAGRAELFVALHRPLAPAAAAFRYHYLASAALTVVVCWVLHRVSTPAMTRWPNAVLVGALAALALSLRAAPAIDHHDQARRETTEVLDTARTHAAAAPPGSTVYIENRRFASVAIFVVEHPALFPGWAAVFLVFQRRNVLDGRTVQFVARDPRELEAAHRGGPIAALLVAPEAVAGRRGTS